MGRRCTNKENMDEKRGVEVICLFCSCTYPSYFLKGHHVLVSIFFLSPALKYVHLATNKCSQIANVSYDQDHRSFDHHHLDFAYARLRLM